MGFLLNHWKELSIFGAISLPVIGFLSKSSTIKWSEPTGYYTQARLFIKPTTQNQVTTSSEDSLQSFPKNYHITQVSSTENTQTNNNLADLMAEFPLQQLDSKNYWKYCLPQGSKLNKVSSQTTSSTSPQEECNLNWYNYHHSKTESVSYLLDVMLKFLKLQHQLNLIFLFHSTSSSSSTATQVSASPNGNQDLLSKIRTACQLSNSSFKDSFLNYLFTSSTPISKNCLITPVKMDIHLTLENGTSQAVSQQSSNSSNNAYSLDALKKGTLSGSIEYSLTDYYGKLHNFQLNGTGGKTPISFTIKPNENYKFKLNDSGVGANNSVLDFNSLYDKYQKRDLKLEDFNCRPTERK